MATSFILRLQLVAVGALIVAIIAEKWNSAPFNGADAAVSPGPGSCESSDKLDQTADKNHLADSLNLLVFVSLLILTVLTIWFFKRRRMRFVHETGLSVIYGLIVGLLIRYTLAPTSERSETVNVTFSSVNFTGDQQYEPPDTLTLVAQDTEPNGSTLYYQYQYKSKLVDFVSEPALESKATFDPEVFFNVILPPIIFNAGYHMKRKHFFKNFGAIVTYAFIGTTISSFAIGGLMYAFCLMVKSISLCFTDCLLFGTIVSATDPVTVLAIFSDLNVDVDLYALVFGESVLNDAVAIVLAGSIEKYNAASGAFDGMEALSSFGNFVGVFCGSFALGCFLGCVTALLTKFTRIQDFALLETSLFILMSYGTFVACEAAGMSGIVGVLFCGICQAHYTYNNLSEESKARTKEVFELLNFLMENFVFAYIGVATFTFRNHNWDPGFISFSFVALIVSRALNIYPLSFLLNLGRTRRIGWNLQHMLMFSGLRGAMAFALAIRNTSTDARKMILSTTLFIVMTTVILCGGFTTQVLLWLKIRVGVEDETELHNFDSLRSKRPPSYSSVNANSVSVNSYVTGVTTSIATTTTPTSADLAVATVGDKARLVRIWCNFDSRFLKPMLTHARPTLIDTLPECCIPLGKFLTSTTQLQHTNGARPRRPGVNDDDSDTECVLNDTDDVIPESNLAIGGRSSTSFPTGQELGILMKSNSKEIVSQQPMPVSSGMPSPNLTSLS